ncbi:hypothetical protein Nepgr_023776 [Nepenthes gracilis]|uniref:MADS-box domain-containing protein n=1 Tax=Nepenthes gracilis TaxID=150966 RepID=A0AAD3T1K0_NEPGR|nr:hypothetical protein Nepgr_023776 [Nepenthes gracilis]
MGRVKLKIKRIESTSNRQVTYSKRRNGIVKKAKEIATLCDIDLILIMFSPAGKPTLRLADRSNLEQVIAKFSRLPAHERAQRKLETLEALRKTFKKLDHDVNIEDFLCTSTQTAEELNNQVTLLQTQLADVQKRLSCWSNPEKIDSVERLSQMEDLLRDSLNQIHLHKEIIAKHDIMSLECSSQFENGLLFPLVMGSIQETPASSWLPHNETEQLHLPGEARFLQQRDLKCYKDCSLLEYCEFYGKRKQIEMDTAGQVNKTIQDFCSLNELGANACLGLEIGDPYPYSPYGSLNLPDYERAIPETGIYFQAQPINCQVTSDFELHGSLFENQFEDLVPAFRPCIVPNYNENLYTYPQPN